MNEKIEKEIDAIKSVLNALDPLEEETRTNVIDYVLRTLKVDLSLLGIKRGPDAEKLTLKEDSDDTTDKPIHIKVFKEQKQPKTDLEMAVLVAYYLQYLTQETDKKKIITTDDLDTNFKIADYPIPQGIRNLLPFAKKAGYMDQVEVGQYRLNAVGYNLIKHNLPRTDSGKSRVHPKSRKQKKK